MAQTTTAITACDASIWLDKLAGTPVDVSGSSNSVALNFSQNLDAQYTFGSRWPRRFACGKDAAFTLVIFYTSTADEGFDVWKNWFFAAVPGTRTLTIYLPTKNVGSDRFQCEVHLESADIPATAGEGTPVMVTLSLLPDGEVTHSVAAT